MVLVARKALYNNNPPVPGEIDDDTPLDGLSTASKISLFITFLMTAAFAVSLFGYIRLSEYVINRFIISVVAIGVFYIIDKLIRGLFTGYCNSVSGLPPSASDTRPCARRNSGSDCCFRR